VTTDENLPERTTPAHYHGQDDAHYERTRQVFRHRALYRRGYYDAKAGQPLRHSLWQRRVRAIALSMLAERVHGDAVMAVVDVGCGRGDFSIEVARRCPQVREVWGTDVVPEALALARAETTPPPNVFFREGDILNMPFADNYFDATLCINVLHHIHAADLPRALAELARITTRCLILEIKNRKHLYYKNRRLRDVDPVGQIKIFPASTADVGGVLSRHGFRLTTAAGICPIRWLSPLLVLRYEKGR
jgi:SAM-dependent methyltransferase